jgi:hypothetical protein
MTFMSRVRRPIVAAGRVWGVALVLAMGGCEDDPDPTAPSPDASVDASADAVSHDVLNSDAGVEAMPTDAGAPCPGAGEYREYEMPGCGSAAEFVCRRPTPDMCAAVIFYCGCDGQTFHGTCGSAPKAYSYRGPCVDASAPDASGDTDSSS